MTRTLLLLFILFSQSLIAQVNLNQGLVAYYPFNGNANDVSGNGNNGIPMNGVQLTTDQYGNPNSAYYFDGVDDYITVPNSASLNPANGLSIVLSFNPSRNGIQNLLGKISYTGAVGTQYQVAMDFNLYPGVLFGVNPITNGCIGTPLNTAYVNTNSPITINQWYCLVATFDNGIMKIYLNGVLIQTSNAGFTTLNQCSNASIQIGTWWNGDPLFFQGKIDNIRIYNRALNQDEVNAVGNCSSTSCYNWLSAPNVGSFVTTGDLDVPGTQITVEATFNRTAPANSTGGYGFLVSKHTGPGNINYALWPNGCGISTTTNGNALLYENCPIELNKTYHVAMTYDGATLKFYRDGFLQSQMPLTGNIIVNDLLTTIGQASNVGAPEIYQFLGYINEVRIWNVARTQAEIQAYMNSSLPNPTTQPGLLAYYVFNDLTNKQGNAAYNGTLGGTASINATNPDCDFIADSCATLPCNDWLSTPSYQSYVSVGDLDIPGDKITVEALINRTQPYLPGTGNNTEGDIVSKHNDPSNVNYLLRPNHAYITTTNGFFATPDVCEIELNKTYHIAMVYDGATLKYYRDGFLMSSVPATGNLYQNDFNTRIGYYDATFWNTNFLGYINEVRIWNVARTQAEIQAYMNSSLPNPTTQPGLLAYYVFNDLTNKQGNAAYNGTLGGAASINATNPDCDFIADSCLISCNTKNDFIFQQSTCDPLSIEFKPSSISFDSIGWDFGDGVTLTNNSNPTHTYSTYGNYTVKMISNIGTCHDTLVRAVKPFF